MKCFFIVLLISFLSLNLNAKNKYKNYDIKYLFEFSYNQNTLRVNENLDKNLSKNYGIEGRFIISSQNNFSSDHNTYKYLSKSNIGIAFSKSLENNANNLINLENNQIKLFYGLSNVSYDFLTIENEFYIYNGILWNKDKFDVPNNLSSNLSLLSNYNNETNFGIMSVSGIRTFPNDHLSINLEMERNLIYPNYLAFQSNLSSFITSLSDVILLKSISALTHKSMYYPLIIFICRSSFSYLIYELKSHQMTWPIKSESAMLQTKFKIGLSYTLY